MPDQSGLSEAVLYVCTTCRASGDASTRTAGARLLTALRDQAADMAPELRVEGIPCLSVCKRPCTVAVASPGRWTYVYGDLDADASAATILAGIGLYAGTEDGIVPWRERPEAFRKGVVARIPPLASAQPDTDAS
ncbi:DUF1636 family protein [Methylobacterium haplocladii]|uniref:Metal-binding protein n=1 Tax=Methylobacterium haplocladii TaxID=1176176 RepID=A0A512IIX5_9HYPH|nr:DUF1636 domain-containing protein [Methylobacterium haplocladii]GEO97655.1 metal-binding protein [Methylobacterium haplocladii]GJD84470.1 hypothetical protein HPGCJGGD_2347 [Methylobacterium haplocladii]GLS57385.1 metal-binding protein [Methylobacterium haplocladii]